MAQSVEELRIVESQLLEVIQGAVTSISIGGVSTTYSPDSARQALRDVRIEIASLSGEDQPNPTFRNISLNF